MLSGRLFPQHLVVDDADLVAAERHQFGEVVLLGRVTLQPVGLLRDEYLHIR